MKVLNLQCSAGHAFEGWFASDSGDEGLECPMCGSLDVQRMPSAPRLNLSGARAPTPATEPAPPADDPTQRWRQVVEALVKNTEDVGPRFPEEARRIHYGEAPPKGIRGQATPEEREALREEGIDVMALPLPMPRPKGTLQ